MVELFDDIASVYVENFVKLANDGFYTDSHWHRVIPGFVIQGGINADDKQVDQFADVFHPDMKHDSAGILSMANAGLNTNTSNSSSNPQRNTPPRPLRLHGQLKPCGSIPGTSCQPSSAKLQQWTYPNAIQQGDVMESVEIHKK